MALRLVNISLRLKQPEKALQYMRLGPDTVPFKLTVASMFMDSRHYLQAESCSSRSWPTAARPARSTCCWRI